MRPGPPQEFFRIIRYWFCTIIICAGIGAGKPSVDNPENDGGNDFCADCYSVSCDELPILAYVFHNKPYAYSILIKGKSISKYLVKYTLISSHA
jgi:hypothetical protein